MELLEKLCQTPGVPGDEGQVRALIRDTIKDRCETSVDAMGNLIARRKGAQSGVRVMLAAHMDEVGFVIRAARDDGLLAFAAPGIDARVLCSKRVKVGKKGVPGVIGTKAIHLQSPEDFGRALKVDNLFIDIGCADKAGALKLVSPGETAVFDSPFVRFGRGMVKSKALDDRVGCAIAINLLLSEKAFPGVDLVAAFTTMEEIGCRGARGVAYSVKPEVAIVLEGTTAGDTPPSEPHEYVCSLGDGPVVSFMDRASIGTPEVFAALCRAGDRAKVKWQVKRGATGGNDGGAIQSTFGPVKTGVLSVPCRYIHSPANVMNENDFASARDLLAEFLETEAAALASK